MRNDNISCDYPVDTHPSNHPHSCSNRMGSFNPGLRWLRGRVTHNHDGLGPCDNVLSSSQSESLTSVYVLVWAVLSLSIT